MGTPSRVRSGFRSRSPILLAIFNGSTRLLLPLIVVICLFVLALLAFVVWRFNEKANPTPSKTTHHRGLEVAWTMAPVIILRVHRRSPRFAC